MSLGDSTGHLDLSSASASAAILAHTRSKPFEVWRPTAQPAAEKAAYHARDCRAPEAIYVAKSTPEGHKAATSAVRDRRSIVSIPAASAGVNPDPSEAEHTAGLQRRASEREKARLAATGAYNMSRRRASTTPTKPVVPEHQPLAASAAGASRGTVQDPSAINPLEDLDATNEASRLTHLTNTDAQLYGSRPRFPDDPEELRRKNVQRAAVVSMSRDMYNIIESKEEQPGTAAYAAQITQGRARSQKSLQKDGNINQAVQQALNIQGVAHKRAQEKLAMMHDENAAFQEYYGTTPQPQRPTLSVLRRRASNDTDMERSKEIRYQMSSLRTKLDAVDEKRESDRSQLMEAARRNVDAAIQDMDQWVYTSTGRAPPSAWEKYEEVAEDRLKEEQQQQTQAEYPDRVNIGAQRFIDMADVEAVARSRVQPTLSEIHDHAEKQRAKELEERLDAEQKQRREATERQREAELRAEEKRMRGKSSVLRDDRIDLTLLESLKKEPKSKKSKRSRAQKPPTEKAEATGAVGAGTGAGAGAGAGAEPEASADTTTSGEDLPEMYRSQTAEGENGLVMPSAVPEEAQPRRSESKLKSWFRGRRRTGRGSRGRRATETAKEQPQKETNTIPATGAGAGTGTAEAAEGTESAEEVEATGGRERSRSAALSSHPITGDELNEMQRRRSSVLSANDEAPRRPPTKENGNGNRRSSWFRNSLMKSFSRNGESKTNGNGVAAAGATSRNGSKNPEAAEPSNARQASTADRDELRESAADQGLPAPPAIGKEASNSTARESRFSEDL